MALGESLRPGVGIECSPPVLGCSDESAGSHSIAVARTNENCPIAISEALKIVVSW